ncbi:MAG TPA: TetR/AcrR family transcriptional regulator [Flavipsychrobacter sp.]|nr:TetR/AcrR family transcriptional regulator [Flavipsychrobacter sp.]
MGITERKERDKQEMRKNIIDAAISMFLEEGFEKTSIRNIAEKIEYSPATIYLYYKDKDELLYDVQGEAFTQMFELFKKEATSEDPLKRLEQICHSYVRFGINNPEMYDLMFIIKAPMNAVEEKDEWRNSENCFDYLLKCVGECIEKKLIRFEDVSIATLSIWSMGHGLISLDIRCRFKVMNMSDEEISQAITKTINEYLRMIKT